MLDTIADGFNCRAVTMSITQMWWAFFMQKIRFMMWLEIGLCILLIPMVGIHLNWVYDMTQFAYGVLMPCLAGVVSVYLLRLNK